MGAFACVPFESGTRMSRLSVDSAASHIIRNMRITVTDWGGVYGGIALICLAGWSRQML